MARGARIALLPLLAIACAHSEAPVEHSPAAVALPTRTMPGEPLGWSVPVGAEQSERNLCIDRALAERGENQVPRVEDKLPASESPLGVQTRSASSYERIMRERPDIAVECARFIDQSDK